MEEISRDLRLRGTCFFSSLSHSAEPKTDACSFSDWKLQRGLWQPGAWRVASNIWWFDILPQWVVACNVCLSDLNVPISFKAPQKFWWQRWKREVRKLHTNHHMSRCLMQLNLIYKMSVINKMSRCFIEIESLTLSTKLPKGKRNPLSWRKP